VERAADGSAAGACTAQNTGTDHGASLAVLKNVRDMLATLFPDAQVRYEQADDGTVTWHLEIIADTPAQLTVALRRAARRTRPGGNNQQAMQDWIAAATDWVKNHPGATPEQVTDAVPHPDGMLVRPLAGAAIAAAARDRRETTDPLGAGEDEAVNGTGITDTPAISGLPATLDARAGAEAQAQ
jgi:hypothetical protein